MRINKMLIIIFALFSKYISQKVNVNENEFQKRQHEC